MSHTFHASRAVTTAHQPRASTSFASSRPKPVEQPVISQTGLSRFIISETPVYVARTSGVKRHGGVRPHAERRGPSRIACLVPARQSTPPQVTDARRLWQGKSWNRSSTGGTRELLPRRLSLGVAGDPGRRPREVGGTAHARRRGKPAIRGVLIVNAGAPLGNTLISRGFAYSSGF